ncbi:MAG TPA: hypothetical protein VMW47_11010 [Verrucomicrobiae bacterium]|nr:hypothetical protein [Verrucomicrobiae bacterium]
MAIDLDALIRAVRSNPEARDTLRRELLTEELLALPERFAQLVQRLDRVVEKVDRIDGYVGDLRGAVYDRQAVRPRMVAGAIGAPVARVHVAPPDVLAARLEAAETAGVLTQKEADAVEVANGVFIWDRDNGASPVWCVVEASITPGWSDMERAGARATSLAKTGVETRALVISTVPPAAELADAMRARGVGWRRVERPRERPGL